MNLKINLGGGNKKINGYKNIDKIKNNNVDIVHDLNIFPYPFENDSISEIIADNVFEHLDDLVKVLEEIYRICKNNAIIKIFVPYFKSTGAFTDITHKHFFSEKSFDFLNDNHEYKYYTKSKFKVIEKKLITKKFSNKHIIRDFLPYKKFFNYFIFNIYDEIYFELKCIK